MQYSPSQEPLCSDSGLQGEGPEVENILGGEHTPVQGIDEATAACILASESPMKERLNGIECQRISPQDNEDDLNKTKERTSSLPSGLHHGLWKANSQDDKINATDATFRDVTFAHGKMLSR